MENKTNNGNNHMKSNTVTTNSKDGKQTKTKHKNSEKKGGAHNGNITNRNFI